MGGKMHMTLMIATAVVMAATAASPTATATKV